MNQILFRFRAFLLFIAILFFIDESLKAQEVNEKYFHNNKQTISFGHGIGNIWKSFLEKGVNIENYTIKSTGPINLQYDYEVFKNFSLGAIVSYSQIRGSYNNSGFVFSDQLTIFTALARVNYHFTKDKKLDPYVGGGCGYIYSKYQNNLNTSSTNVPGEFGYSAQVGLNYFILNNTGLFGEFGYLGGSFVQLGFVLNLSQDSKKKTE
jgi:opacity protein-like surface antigen